MNIQEAREAMRSDMHSYWDSRGVRWEPGFEPSLYINDDPNLGIPYGLAYDALPTMSTEASSGIPAMLSTFIDPQIYEILFAPILVAEALGGEVQKGSWTDTAAMFPVGEVTGEVSSYDDMGSQGVSGYNMNYPNVESYLFHTNITYGDREVAMAAAGRFNIVAEKERAATTNLNRFMNYCYAYGVQGLQNYGTINAPELSVSLTPALKAYGGTTWFSGGVVRATANEIFTDFQTVIGQLIIQGDGQINTRTAMTAIFAATVENALTTTNAFGVSVTELLKKNYPNLKLVSGVQQYGSRTTYNSQGLAAGNLLQIIANDVGGQKAGFCAYNERMRAHRIVPELSSFKQKRTSGTWGSIIRMPLAISSMLGI